MTTYKPVALNFVFATSVVLRRNLRVRLATWGKSTQVQLEALFDYLGVHFARALPMTCLQPGHFIIMLSETETKNKNGNRLSLVRLGLNPHIGKETGLYSFEHVVLILELCNNNYDFLWFLSFGSFERRVIIILFFDVPRTLVTSRCRVPCELRSEV